MARTAHVERTTNESSVVIDLNLDGTGQIDVQTGVPFYDHMLAQLGKHGGFDLTVRATGDLHIDAHHTVEDCGIAIGEAVISALGNKKGINRAGYFVMPMDETLAVAAIDLSGRPATVIDTKVTVDTVGAV